ncbi:hypothetical protein HBI82_026220 [Parastagonospora nodorum]|nr:hypothetical protein HBH49_006040 [Parastagonospora nodorum]KAH4964856.1 hypothetical protein HBI78_103040 [Parastagonospora nodorum]KAH4995256.1 hypothetical protein HBI76_008280 [Parastagonospora nodorum]KAH5229067.1 hypothetical protein HBH77_013400 [Parastagonospora nodorum]KAH5371239.1 hypothetical protein HBI48_032240 [Parastagonospora nodorum]
MSQPTLTGAPSLYPPSSFPTHLTATCLCTAIRVTITDSELFTRPRGHLCHCSNCRKVAGSYVSSNLAIEKEKVSVEDPKGVMKRYRDMQTGSGKCVERCFCGECGNPIMSIAEIFPTMVIVKMGMFPRIPQPECESFAAHRHEWQGKHEGLVQYEIARGGKKLGQGT